MPTIPAATAAAATTAATEQPSGPPERRSGRVRWYAAAAVAGFVATVVAANALTATFGLIPVGFGLTATAGTAAAGLTLLARDAVHHLAGRATVAACIIAGALLSAGLAGPRLALASATAFGLSELADLLVYQRLIRRGWITAAVASSTVAAPIDSVVFLGLAGFPIWAALPGQVWVKTAALAVPLAAVIAARALLRHRLRSRRS
jgi:queuosine precursor transporter